MSYFSHSRPDPNHAAGKSLVCGLPCLPVVVRVVAPYGQFRPLVGKPFEHVMDIRLADLDPLF